MSSEETPNPIIYETGLWAYPGWTVRQYKNGMYDATNGTALTIGSTTFADAVAEVHKLARQ